MVFERSDIMLVIVGFMSVRYPFGFAISQLLCYTMMTGFNLFLYVSSRSPTFFLSFFAV